MAGPEGGRREPEYRVIRAQEDERKRLARDLHDGLIQSLVGLGLNLELLERHVEADPVRKPEALAVVAKLRETVSGCLEEGRRILSDLRPLELNGRSLAQALKDYAERASVEAGLRVTVVISGQETPIHPSLEAGLFRIFQEVLSNVREHAGASEVSLKLRFLPKSVSMDVADNGAGFELPRDLADLAGRRCFGLIGIDERVKLLGGAWRVNTKPGGGTEVRIRLPVVKRSGFWSFLANLSGNGREAEGGGEAPRETRPAREAQRSRGTRPTRAARSGAATAGDEGDSSRSPPREAPPVRILLADDHRVVREGLKMMFDLTQGLEVVGEAATGDAAVRLARELSPDVVLLDLVMPGAASDVVTREILRQNPRTRVLILTAHFDAGGVKELLDAGATGYLLKTADAGEITRAVRAVHEGVVTLAPEALRALSAPAAAPSGPVPAPGWGPGAVPEAAADLTLREQEVLRLVGDGLTNEEIARKLYISEKTVRNHLGAIIRKLDLDDRTQVALAARGFAPAGRSQS